jgi:hypothetical protein
MPQSGGANPEATSAPSPEQPPAPEPDPEPTSETGGDAAAAISTPITLEPLPELSEPLQKPIDPPQQAEITSETLTNRDARSGPSDTVSTSPLHLSLQPVERFSLDLYFHSEVLLDILRDPPTREPNAFIPTSMRSTVKQLGPQWRKYMWWGARVRSLALKIFEDEPQARLKAFYMWEDAVNRQRRHNKTKRRSADGDMDLKDPQDAGLYSLASGVILGARDTGLD